MTADLLSVVIKQRDNSEVRFREAMVICQRSSQPPRTHDADAMWSIEAENLCQMLAQIVHEITCAAHTELAEVTEILANLRGVEIELLGEFLRRDGLNSRRCQLVQAAEIDA